MLADQSATHLTEDERAYLAKLAAPVRLFHDFLVSKYGADAVMFNPDTGQIIRATPTLPPERPIEHTTPDGKDKQTSVQEDS